MKSKSIAVTFLTAFVLTCPALTFAGAQPTKVRMPSKADLQNNIVAGRAVNQGKGAGLTRNAVLQANAWRMQTEEERITLADKTLADKTGAAHPSWTDIAFRK